MFTVFTHFFPNNDTKKSIHNEINIKKLKMERPFLYAQLNYSKRAIKIVIIVGQIAVFIVPIHA